MQTEAELLLSMTERLRRQSGPYPRIVTITEAELLCGYSRDDRETVCRELGISR